MAPALQASSASQIPHLSPVELSYLYTSLALPDGSIRPDGRSPTQFRPLTAETGILPGASGSARIGFADGTQVIVGIKAEVEKTVLPSDALDLRQLHLQDQANYAGSEDADGREKSSATAGQSSWVQMSIEIPGFRDDDALPVFLSEMMRESLVGSAATGGSDGESNRKFAGLKGRLVINRRWHWRLYLDILLLSPPLSYPLPLLSLTTHLALLSTRLPKLKSKNEEDPLFDDDWNAAEYLYPRPKARPAYDSRIGREPPGFPPPSQKLVRPPVTLLIISAGDNIIFDPSREEIAVADAVLAVSIGREDENSNANHAKLKLLSIRTIDPPSRLTQPGVPDSENATALGATSLGAPTSTTADEVGSLTPSSTAMSSGEEVPGVWRPRRGGVKRSLISRMVKMVLEKGGVGEEVMDGLEGVEVD